MSEDESGVQTLSLICDLYHMWQLVKYNSHCKHYLHRGFINAQALAKWTGCEDYFQLSAWFEHPEETFPFLLFHFLFTISVKTSLLLLKSLMKLLIAVCYVALQSARVIYLFSNAVR